MKNYLHHRLLVFVVLSCGLMFLTTCSKSDDQNNSAAQPMLTTTAISAITETTATSGGNITNDCNGTITARGVCWSTRTNPTTADSKTSDGTGVGSFTSNITGLTGNTIYYVRAYATNSAGTSYGNQVGFTTSQNILLPTVTTTSARSHTQTTATSGGNISADGGTTVTVRGICWSTSANPTTADSRTYDGTGVGSFTSSITGLTENTTYYVRAYATNSAGTAYGNTVAFTTLTQGGVETVTDIDGNVYHTVTIGTQVWMVENLKTTKYSNGILIPNITSDIYWDALNLTTGAYCNYNNDDNNVITYGRLYNWYAVSDIQNIAPTGWHVPTYAEWNTLIDSLFKEHDGYTYWETNYNFVGKSMAATSGWETSTNDRAIGNDQASNNSSGFTGLPGGTRYYNGKFYNIGSQGSWWSSTEFDIHNAWSFDLHYNTAHLSEYPFRNKSEGFAIRCVRD